MSVLNIDYSITGNITTKLTNVPISEKYMFYAVGEFDGGILELEASPDDGATWFTVDSLTEQGRIIRYLVSGEKIRMSLTGSGSADITAGIRQ